MSIVNVHNLIKRHCVTIVAFITHYLKHMVHSFKRWQNAKFMVYSENFIPRGLKQKANSTPASHTDSQHAGQPTCTHNLPAAAHHARRSAGHRLAANTQAHQADNITHAQHAANITHAQHASRLSHLNRRSPATQPPRDLARFAHVHPSWPRHGAP